MNTILIVDDEARNIDLLDNCLCEAGFDVLVAENGETAIKRVGYVTPDLILLDVKMPGIDGFETCRRLKEHETAYDVPIIFLTAAADTSDKVKGFEAGAVDYITKPFQVEEVLVRIRTHITIREQQRQLQEQQERFQKLSDASFEGIFIHYQGKIIESNQTLADMLGFEHNELTGKSGFDLLLRQSHDEFAVHTEKNIEGPYETRFVKRDGTLLPVEVRTREIKWQGRKLKMAAVRDMSWRNMLRQERRVFDMELKDSEHLGALVGKSKAMKKVYEFILRAAATDSPVVIYGETGAGKELTARTIFTTSDFYSKCFVPVNCASIPDHLFESLFFGHRKGAFTGANRNHAGYFEQARGGVLFLDEVGDLPLAMQAKLLRVLEDQTYTPVGASTDRQADVRIIAATNKALSILVSKGKIRNDFFYRLHVLNIDLPALRFHKEDIPLLIAHFLRQNVEYISPLPNIPQDIIQLFMEYTWPGNVRELYNELQRWLSTGDVELAGDLSDSLSQERIGPDVEDNLPLNKALEYFEQYYIPRILNLHGGHKGKTADILKVDRKTLYRKLKKYGLA